MRGSIIRRSHHWIVNRGWQGFVAELWRRFRIQLSGKRRIGDAKPAVHSIHPFDEAYGVETSGLIFGEQLDTPDPQAYWATAYYGVSPSVFSAALERLGPALPDPGWPAYTFVDIGCGKGRAMMLATAHPFRAVTGVELSPTLCATARENLKRFAPPWRRAPQAMVECADAAVAPLPAGPLVVWIYHPFAAPVMRRFLAHLQASLRAEPREAWLLYINPELNPMLRALPWLRFTWEECLPMSPEDRAADRFGSEWEKVTAYRAMAGEA